MLKTFKCKVYKQHFKKSAKHIDQASFSYHFILGTRFLCKSKYLELDVCICRYSHIISIKLHLILPWNEIIHWLLTACQTLWCPRSIPHFLHPTWSLHHWLSVNHFVSGNCVTFNNLSTSRCHIHQSLPVVKDVNLNAKMNWRLS